MNRKLITSIGILVISFLCIIYLWTHAALLSFLLMLLAYVKHKIYPIKKELLWFVLICVVGAIVEIIMVNIGHAWSYSASQILGIPIWMAIFWGLVGTTIIVIYNELTKTH